MLTSEIFYPLPSGTRVLVKVLVLEELEDFHLEAFQVLLLLVFLDLVVEVEAFLPWVVVSAWEIPFPQLMVHLKWKVLYELQSVRIHMPCVARK